MVQAVTDLNNSIWFALEEALTPLPKDSKNSRLIHALPAIALFPAGVVSGSCVIVCRVISYTLGFFSTQKKPHPKNDFYVVVEDSRHWEHLGNLEEQITLGRGDEDFLFGTATATFQDSGAVNCPDSQWADHEKTCLPEKNRSGKSAGLFDLYEFSIGHYEITDRLHKLGINSYRFSIEWSHIEPRPGVFNERNLKIYVGFCKHLRDEGIKPMVTLHHFSEPKWFFELGSFEKEANIPYFVQFSETVFASLTQDYKGKPLVEYFCTINEPGVEAFSRYVLGSFAPAKMFRFEQAGNFLKNALKAHIQVYEKLKSQSSPTVQIGIAHQRLSMLATNPIIYPVTRYLSRLLNEVAMNFFKTGKFELKIPFSCHIVEKGFKPKTDFIGLQYYVRPLIGLAGPTSYHEPMTQMPFREDPEGIYEAILETHEHFKAPVIVTENGISTHDDEQRSRYMLRALYAVQRAQDRIGKENLRGYYAWSFCDNFEWNMGHDPQKFGVYALEMINGIRRLSKEPKKGIQSSYMKVIAAWRRSLVQQQVA